MKTKFDTKGVETTLWWKNLIPIVLGIVLSAIGTLTNFAYDRIDELHSYECPSVVVLNVDDGNKSFLDWIENSTN